MATLPISESLANRKFRFCRQMKFRVWFSQPVVLEVAGKCESDVVCEILQVRKLEESFLFGHFNCASFQVPLRDDFLSLIFLSRHRSDSVSSDRERNRFILMLVHDYFAVDVQYA